MQMGNPRAGAIPGAVHWDYVDLLELVQGSKEAFVEGAKARGITPQSSIITYCQGGMRAVGLLCCHPPRQPLPHPTLLFLLLLLQY